MPYLVFDLAPNQVYFSIIDILGINCDLPLVYGTLRAL